MARLAVRPSRDGGSRADAWWPWLLVAGTVGWNLVSLRALTLKVAYLNDSWFPFVGDGSPNFLHYQSLPAILTGLVGLALVVQEVR